MVSWFHGFMVDRSFSDVSFTVCSNTAMLKARWQSVKHQTIQLPNHETMKP
jgi:hypothetical protein